MIGADCNLCDHTFIEGGVRLGDRVTVKSGVHLWQGIEAEDDVFLGPAAAFTNDLRPRSRQPPAEYPRTLLARGASVGANATVLPGRTLGAWCMVAAGAVVSRDVPPYTLVRGVPARATGWVCRCGESLTGDGPQLACVCGLAYTLASGGISRAESPR